MEWAVAEGADVISMSIGTSEPVDCTDPMAAAVDRIGASSGVLFVVAAGNLGGPAEAITSPGCAASAMSVAATDLTQTTADFSSRGPVLANHAVKPDIAAPVWTSPRQQPDLRSDCRQLDPRVEPQLWHAGEVDLARHDAEGPPRVLRGGRGWQYGSPAGARSPYLYSLAFTHEQQVKGKPEHRVKDRELATIDATYYTPGKAYNYSEYVDVWRPWSINLIPTGDRGPWRRRPGCSIWSRPIGIRR